MHLIDLELKCSIDVETIRKVLEEAEFFSLFKFKYADKWFKVRIDYAPKRFTILHCRKWTEFADLNGAVQFIQTEAEK